MSFIPSGVAAAAAAGVSPTPPFPDLPPGGVASEYTVVAGESVNLIGYNTDPDSGQSIGTISPTTEWINDQFAIVTKAKNKFGEAGSVFTLQSAAPPPNSDTIFHSMRVRGVFAGSSEVQVYTQLRTGSIYSTDGINKSSWEQGSISDVWVDGNTYDVQLVRVPLYSPVFTGRIYCRMEDTGLEGFVAYRTANTQAMWVVVPYDDAQDIRLSRRDTDGAYTLVSLPDGSTPEWLTYNDDTNSPGSQNYLYFVQEGAPNQDRCHFAIADIDSEWNMITDRASLAVKAELFDPNWWCHFALGAAAPNLLWFDITKEYWAIGNAGSLYGYRSPTHPISQFGGLNPDNVGGLPVYQLTVNTSSNIVVAELGINGGQQIDSVDTLLLEINGGANSTTLVWTGTWYEVNDPAFVSAVVAAVDTPLDFSVTPVSPPSTPSYFNFDVPLDIIDAVGVNAFSYDAGATQPGDTLLVFVTSAVGAGPLSGVTYAGSDMTLRFTPTGWPNVNAPQTWIYTLDNPPANSNQMVVTYVTSPSAVTDLRVFAMVLRNGQLGNIEQAAYFGDTGTNDLPITIQSADSAVLLVYSNERSNENLGIGPGSDPLRIVDDRQANGFASLFCDNLSPGAGVFTAQLTTTATGRRRHALLVEVLPSQ